MVGQIVHYAPELKSVNKLHQGMPILNTVKNPLSTAFSHVKMNDDQLARIFELQTQTKHM
jgi:hypothetical protein